eukprot:TRINITY_DN11694_c0_g1_i2.p1 TRINITY_DN11694_c0_g1~~TRINITY_DN11694_c0_g1_i2.p1  ORF type:complete len:330 (+),score=62.33 TRINITY_DN11694_c0_g1_i2:84-1073(+)
MTGRGSDAQSSPRAAFEPGLSERRQVLSPTAAAPHSYQGCHRRRPLSPRRARKGRVRFNAGRRDAHEVVIPEGPGPGQYTPAPPAGGSRRLFIPRGPSGEGAEAFHTVYATRQHGDERSGVGPAAGTFGLAPRFAAVPLRCAWQAASAAPFAPRCPGPGNYRVPLAKCGQWVGPYSLRAAAADQLLGSGPAARIASRGVVDRRRGWAIPILDCLGANGGPGAYELGAGHRAGCGRCKTFNSSHRRQWHRRSVLAVASSPVRRGGARPQSAPAGGRAAAAARSQQQLQQSDDDSIGRPATARPGGLSLLLPAGVPAPPRPLSARPASGRP